MHIRTQAIAMALVGLGAGGADAQTCSFDDASGVLSVVMLGEFGTLRVVSGGAIELDGAPCGSATTTSTSKIVATGTDGDIDKLTLIGTFAPGRNDVPESGSPEIEVTLVSFNDFNDWLEMLGANGVDDWRFTLSGIDVNGDGDRDVQSPTAGRILVRMRNGNDTVNASAYAGNCDLTLQGGEGDDTLTGSKRADTLIGEVGNDTLRGGAGDDDIDDGPGSDFVRGGGGNDRMGGGQATDVDGTDDFRGGAGIDEVSYIVRDTDVNVSIDDVANDGAPGELDNVHTDVENVTSGRGNDVLVGSAAANELDGTWGSNEIYGGPGDDYLQAGIGDATTSNIVLGEGGDDILSGSGGVNFLDGGGGNDELRGYAGNDTLDGGGGADEFFGGFGDDVIYNADGLQEIVDCGDGIDVPEWEPFDTFLFCENI